MANFLPFQDIERALAKKQAQKGARFFVTCLFFVAFATNAAVLEGRIIGITDGDTVTLLDASKTQYKIRLQGIDAPESKQPFGQASKRHLSKLLFNRQVVAQCAKTDRYKRKVCVILVEGRDANRSQIKAGMAWWYRKYQNEQTPQQRVDYEEAEGKAKAEGIGLWREREPIPPWEWRKQK